MASIGAENVKTETFSVVTSSVESVANFTEGVVAFVTANGLDGLEVDWRWPGQNGGDKDKDDVTTLMKVRVEGDDDKDEDEDGGDDEEDDGSDYYNDTSIFQFQKMIMKLS